MKQYLVTLSLIFSCITAAIAQNGTIRGKITQLDSATAISGVSVKLTETNMGSATNGKGEYIIKNVPPGNYEIKVSSIGYFTMEKEIDLKPGQELKVDFFMIEGISTLSEVTVITGGLGGLKDIPGSVHYISPKEIQKFNYTDINRTLRAVPGINMQEEDGFGLRPNIGLRGTGVERSSKITLMEDGVLMAPAPYSAPAAYYFPTIGRMEAVEILKGSSQIKYGPYTTGGAINLISTSIPEDFSGKVNLFGGSFGNRNLHAMAGNSHKNIAYMVETFQYGSNGFKDLDNGGNTGFDKKDFLAKFRINTNETAPVYQSLLIKGGQVSEVSNETYLGLTESDFENTPFRRYAGSQMDQMNTEQNQMSANYVVRFAKWFNVNTVAYRNTFKRNWYKLDKVADANGNKTSISSLLENPQENRELYNILTGQTSTYNDALLVKANNRAYISQGIQSSFNFDFETKSLEHQIELGIRYHQDEVDRFQWVDGYRMTNDFMQQTFKGAHGTESNRISTANALATFIQYQLVWENLRITPGLRNEQIQLSREDYGKNDPNRTGVDLKERSNEVAVWIPGIGADYDFGKNLTVFGGVHKGFAPPSSKEGALPEESINYELGSRYNRNGLSGELVVFYNDYSNLLGADLNASGGGGTGDLFNGGEVVTQGLEFQMTYDLLSYKAKGYALPVTVTYTYTDASFQNSFNSDFDGWGAVNAGDQFPYLANNQFAFMVTLEHDDFNISFSGRYMDEMRTLPGQGNIPADEKTDDYFVVDMSATYNIHKNISLFSSITNITDEVYVVARRPAGLRPGMPRAGIAGLKVVF